MTSSEKESKHFRQITLIPHNFVTLSKFPKAYGQLRPEVNGGVKPPVDLRLKIIMKYVGERFTESDDLGGEFFSVFFFPIFRQFSF